MARTALNFRLHLCRWSCTLRPLANSVASAVLWVYSWNQEFTTNFWGLLWLLGFIPSTCWCSHPGPEVHPPTTAVCLRPHRSLASEMHCHLREHPIYPRVYTNSHLSSLENFRGPHLTSTVPGNIPPSSKWKALPFPHQFFFFCPLISYSFFRRKALWIFYKGLLYLQRWTNKFSPIVSMTIW